MHIVYNNNKINLPTSCKVLSHDMDDCDSIIGGQISELSQGNTYKKITIVIMHNNMDATRQKRLIGDMSFLFQKSFCSLPSITITGISS